MAICKKIKELRTNLDIFIFKDDIKAGGILSPFTNVGYATTYESDTDKQLELYQERVTVYAEGRLTEEDVDLLTEHTSKVSYAELAEWSEASKALSEYWLLSEIYLYEIEGALADVYTAATLIGKNEGSKPFAIVIAQS